MEITGTFIKVLDETSGVRKSDGVSWRKKDILLSLGGTPEKYLHVSLFNDNFQTKMDEGDTVKLDVSLKSREYNGKWYYDVFASNVSVISNKTYHQNEDGGDPITYKPKYNNAKEVRDAAVNNSLEPQENDLPF